MSFPSRIFEFVLGTSKAAELFSVFLGKALCCVLPVWLTFEIRADKLYLPKKIWKNALLLIPFFIVALNNFPFFPLFFGQAEWLEYDFLTVVCYLLACLGGVVLEESVFRGLVFPTIYRQLRSKKHGVFISLFLSSALFGVTHLLNLLAGASFGSVIMQIGYSFLIGGMCAISTLYSCRIYDAFILHFVFNVGGLLYERDMISGNIWTPLTIALTAVIGVLVFVYALVLLSKKKDDFYAEIEYITPDERQEL